MALESTIEQAAVRKAKDLGILTRKFVSPGHVGVPDRLFMHNGVVFFVEFKAPGKKPTPMQFRELQLIKGQGCLATWVDSIEEIGMLLTLMTLGREDLKTYLQGG